MLVSFASLLLVVQASTKASASATATSSGSAAATTPTFTSNAALSCGEDPYKFATNTDASDLTVRAEHPLLIAPAYKWGCIADTLIPGDSYMASWNKTNFANATAKYDMSPTNYSIDGCLSCSGVLDVAREVQQRIKFWAYAWKMSNDTKWVDRAWTELEVAAGNTSQSFGTDGDNWNSAHFLDLAEFTAAYAMAYDWMYDGFNQTQRDAIMWSIINLGLHYGELVFTGASNASSYSWWATNTQGNWNCVNNNGLTMGALAIYNEDPTGLAKKILAWTIPNTLVNCAQGPSSDGTWSETPDYWYFGTYTHTEMALSLLSAVGNTMDLYNTNPNFYKTGYFHMYVNGINDDDDTMFSYGDNGPNKYTANANHLMAYATIYDKPEMMLYQRDALDAADVLSMLYYDPQVSGQYWSGLALDRHFDNVTSAWVSMRSSWTDTKGNFVAMKTSPIEGHQNHGDIDAGDFVLDALGQRWAGELGDGNYLAEDYFTGELQSSDRWLYYRKRTEGQNTLLYDGDNQWVDGVIPATTFGTTNDTQDVEDFTVSNGSTAYFVADLSDMYYGNSTKRGIRFVNNRQQVLLQDEVTVPAGGVQWRMHTNATVSTSNGNLTATLELGGQKLEALLTVSPAGAAVFSTAEPVRLSTDPSVPTESGSQDQPNPGVTVLVIDLTATGNVTIEVLFNPQASGASFITPPSVALADWSLTSHE